MMNSPPESTEVKAVDQRDMSNNRLHKPPNLKLMK